MVPHSRNRTLRAITLLCTLLLAGCGNTRFAVPEGTLDEAAYTAIFPYYAEYCALSEIRKKPGWGVAVEGAGPGGHSILYLNGVCRVRSAGYPEIALCDEATAASQGVGLSVNAHYRNANWVATEGRDFVFRGGVTPGAPLSRARYAQTQAEAKAMGILDGVVFHDEVFADKPADMAERDYMYEVSVATDYAIGFGRDQYCARVPVDRARMQGVVAHLNALQTPYRSGQTAFNWDVLRNNCAHTTHNALATVGVWGEWPVERPLLVAAFDFPVPKNEFVNLMRRTNDMPVDDPAALYDDDTARAALLGKDWIATRPGGLAHAARAIAVNEVYDTALRLIFYDEPIYGRYQRRWDTIYATPRYTDLRANLLHFQGLYRAILADGAAYRVPASFRERYTAHIRQESAKLDQALAALPPIIR